MKKTNIMNAFVVEKSLEWVETFILIYQSIDFY